MKAWVIGGIGFLALASCSTFDHEAFIKAMDTGMVKLTKEGILDEVQYRAVMDIIRGASEVLAKGGGIGDVLREVGQAIATLVAGYFGIRLWRGSPNSRKGSVPPPGS